MPLNAEEKYQQALYEEKIANQEIENTLLTERLELAQETINLVNSQLDIYNEQHKKIDQAITLYKLGERSEGITLESICAIVGCN